jgi:hypothetical protein
MVLELFIVWKAFTEWVVYSERAEYTEQVVYAERAVITVQAIYTKRAVFIVYMVFIDICRNTGVPFKTGM